MNADTNHPFLNVPMSLLYQKTIDREMALKKLGIVVHSMWECEFRDIIQSDETVRAYVEALDEVDPLNARDAFYGGRTGATRLYAVAEVGTKIYYFDFTS